MIIKFSDGLGGGKNVLFSGTPCQVAALKQYLRKPFDNLYTCDILCHGVPSPKVFTDYRKFIEHMYGKKITSIFMKDKSKGWGYQQSLRIRFDDDSEIKLNPDTQLWNDIFHSELVTRPCCHHCRFTTTNRQGDISIGDYWGIEKAHPEVYDNRGISLVIASTAKGVELLEKIKDSITCSSSTIEKCLQPVLQHPTPASVLRQQFWLDYQKLTFQQIATKYWHYGNLARLKLRIRTLLYRLTKRLQL